MELYIIMCLNTFITIDEFKSIGRGPYVLYISQFRRIPKTIFTTTPL